MLNKVKLSFIFFVSYRLQLFSSIRTRNLCSCYYSLLLYSFLSFKSYVIIENRFDPDFLCAITYKCNIYEFLIKNTRFCFRTHANCHSSWTFVFFITIAFIRNHNCKTHKHIYHNIRRGVLKFDLARTESIFTRNFECSLVICNKLQRALLKWLY